MIKEKSWIVFDLKSLDRAWSDYTIDELVDKIERQELRNPDLVEEARKLSKGVVSVRWLGSAYLGTYKNQEEAQSYQVKKDREITSSLERLRRAGAGDRSLWQFYASRWFFDRWFSPLPGEIDLDYALMSYFTYTGARFQEQTFQGILFGPCREKGLLRRNFIAGNVQEVPAIEEVGYEPGFHEAILSITEAYLRERLTRAELADEAWMLVLTLQKSIRFARDKGLATYITGDNELTIAPDFSFSGRQSGHRSSPPKLPERTAK